jgi:signal transduction histidine kinase
MTHDKTKIDLDFMLMLAHELRAPLGIVKESIALVNDRILGKTNEKQQKVLTTARKNVNRIDRIIMNVVDIFKLDENRLELRKEPVDIVAVARRVLDSFRAISDPKGLTMKAVFSSDEMMCLADKQRLSDIFSHLIGNAVKFTEKGSIELEIRQLKKNIECSVRDTGIGIAREHAPHIFDKFAQFGWVPGGGEKGMGLGLAITKGLVELHGGTLRVSSEPGAGSEFVFTIPTEKH